MKSSVWCLTFCLVVAAHLVFAGPSFGRMSTVLFGVEARENGRSSFAMYDTNCTQTYGSNCTGCTADTSCLWCEGDKTCYDFGDVSAVSACSSGLCQAGACDCDETIWPETNGWFSEVVMMLFYGIILAVGAKWIADGSEELLEIVDPGIIGALLLPILGALPDSMMIIVSALGDPATAQEQIAVGMGTLAGSTVMLLTVPWVGALFLARCDFDKRTGIAKDRTLTRPFCDLTGTGVTVDKDTTLNAKIALVVSLSFLIVQFPSFFYWKEETDPATISVIKWFALAGFIICFIALAGYVGWQIYNPKLQEKKTKLARQEALLKRALEKFIFLHDAMESQREDDNNEDDPLLAPPKPEINVSSVGLQWRAFAAGGASVNQDGPSQPGDHKAIQVEEEKSESEDEDDEEGEGEGGVKTLSEKLKILGGAMLWMGLGVGIVFLFSDPMVDVINRFGNTIHVGSFYVSFVITPFCSNASELISSLIFAARKRRKNTSMTYSALYGAAVMNSTMCLGIFYLLIFVRSLAWTFNAECLGILITIWGVCGFGAFRTKFPTWTGFIVILFYPLSLGVVAFLEQVLHWT